MDHSLDQAIDECWLESHNYSGRWRLDFDFHLEIRHWGVSLIHIGYRDSESILEINGIKTRQQLLSFLGAVDPLNNRSKIK